MLEFLELLGLLHVTIGKNILSCENSRVMSLPRNIFATKVPPGRKILVVIFNADSNNCACIYSSIS